MTSVSMDVVTDPSPVNTESAGVEDAESSQGGKPAQPEPGKDLTAEEEALLLAPRNLDRKVTSGLSSLRGACGTVFRALQTSPLAAPGLGGHALLAAALPEPPEPCGRIGSLALPSVTLD